jgi:hypothetical protein
MGGVRVPHASGVLSKIGFTDFSLYHQALSTFLHDFDSFPFPALDLFGLCGYASEGAVSRICCFQ